MVTISKVLPKEFDLDRRYIVRVRSVNAFGNVSKWSNSIFLDPSLSSWPQNRVVETSTALSIFGDAGQMIFAAFTEEDYRINYVKNPSFETNLNTWSALSNSVIARTEIDSFFGLNSVKITPSIDTVGNLGIINNISGLIDVQPEEIYSASAYVYRHYKPASHDEFADPDFSLFELLINLYDSSNNLLASANESNYIQVPNKNWVRIKGRNLVIPKGVSKIGLTIRYSATNVENVYTDEYILIDGIMVEMAPIVGTYFDGDTVMDVTGWDGTPHASTSHFDNMDGS